MGCTPSKLAIVYGQDTVCRDLDTCSTFVPSLKSSVSTPEKPRLRVDASSDQTLLSVPCPNVLGLPASQSQPACWSSAGSAAPGAPCCPEQLSSEPRSPTPDLRGDTTGKLAQDAETV